MRELKVGDKALICGFHTIDENGNWRYLNGLEEILLSLYSSTLGDGNGFNDLALKVENIIVSIEEIEITDKYIYDVIEHEVTRFPHIDFGYSGEFTRPDLTFCHLTYRNPKDELPKYKGSYRWTLKGEMKETPIVSLLKEKGLPYAMYDLELLYGYITNLLTTDLAAAFRAEKTDLLQHIAKTLTQKHPKWTITYLADTVEIRKM